MDRNEITYAIRGAAFAVHSNLGPGLLESAYEKCLLYELRQRRLKVRTQVGLPEAVEALAPIHTAQLLTYLKLARKPLGLLMNFHVANMQHGIKRCIIEKALGRKI